MQYLADSQPLRHRWAGRVLELKVLGRLLCHRTFEDGEDGTGRPGVRWNYAPRSSRIQACGRKPGLAGGLGAGKR
jgi:hypothetical protein